MNAQHSSKNEGWQTPIQVIELARKVLDGIDTDPASCAVANERVKAHVWYGEEHNGLYQPWGYPLPYPAIENFGPASIFLNPPGGKIGNQSSTFLWWKKLLDEVEAGHVSHAIFLCFNLDSLCTLQGHGVDAPTAFPCCIPNKRIRFLHPDGTAEKSPTHGNSIVYVPGAVDKSTRFFRVFQELGDVVAPAGWIFK